MNGLSARSVRRVAREAGIHPANIVRATVVSHSDYWVVWLTLRGHLHAAYDRREQELEWFPGRQVDGVCTSLCRELFPDDFA